MMTMLTMNLLAGGAMAVLRIQRLFAAQLVPHLSAVAATIVASLEVWVIVVDLVGCSMFPLIQLALCVPVVTIVTVASICRCVSHSSGTGMKLRLIET